MPPKFLAALTNYGRPCRNKNENGEGWCHENGYNANDVGNSVSGYGNSGGLEVLWKDGGVSGNGAFSKATFPC